MESASSGVARILRTRAAVMATLCLAGLALAPAAARADVSSVYPDVVFGDGFESGSTSAWSPALGTGTATVSAAAAHAGSFGLRLANGVGQYTLVPKTLPSAVTDSSTSFWMRTSATGGIVTVAQARDGSSAGQLWDLVYDAGARAFSLFPYKSSGSVELTTGPNAVAAANTWVQVEVRYNAATDGGARLYVNGQTQPSWGVTGDFSHSSDYRILQLWNDGGSATFRLRRRQRRPPVAGADGAGRAHRRVGPGRQRGGDAHVDRARRHRRQPDHLLPDHAARRRLGPDPGRHRLGDGRRAGRRPHERHGVHVHGRRDDHGRHGRGLGRERRGHAARRGDGPGRADRGLRPRGRRVGRPDLDRPGRRRRRGDLELPDHPVCRHDGADRHRHGIGGHERDRPRPHERDRVHVQGRGEELGRDGAGLGCERPRDPDRVGVHGRRVLRRLRVGRPRRVDADARDRVGDGHGGGEGPRGVRAAARRRRGPVDARGEDARADGRRQLDAVQLPHERDERVRGRGRGARLGQLRPHVDAAVRRRVAQLPLLSVHGVGERRDRHRRRQRPRAGHVDGPRGPLRRRERRRRPALHRRPDPGVLGDDGRPDALGRLPDPPALERRQRGHLRLRRRQGRRPAREHERARRPDRRDRHRRRRLGGARLDGPGERRRQPGDGLPDHAFRRRRGPDAGRHRLDDHVAHDHGPHERHRLHVHGCRDERGRHRPASTPSAALTPRAAPTAPGAPTGVAGTAGNASVALHWTAPADDGNSAITGYRITPFVGTTAQTPVDTGSTTTSRTITGLANGSAYTFEVAATNSVGTGAQSAASDPVTPAAPAVPGAPGRPTGAAGDKSVALTWTAPAGDGGSPITGYRITPFAGGTAQTPIDTGSTSMSRTVTGLTDGTAYTFTVAATNAVGTGPASPASAAVTPQAAKTIVSIEFDDGIETQFQTLAMLQAHGMHGTYFVNSGLTTDDIGWRMSWPQLRQIAAAGDEIAGHSWDHADLTTLSAADQQHEICDDRTNIQSHGLPLPTEFAYPYGAYEQNNVPAMVEQCGYSSAREVGGVQSDICPTGCPFAETLPPADPFVTRTAPDIRIDTTLAMVEGYVTQAEQHGGGWVQLVFHDMCSTDCTGDDYSTTPAMLGQFLDWLQPRAANGTVTETVSQALGG